MVLEGIPMGTIYHQNLFLTLLLERLLGDPDAVGIVIRTSATTTKNDKAVVIPGCTCNSRKALFCNSHKMVGT